VDVREEGAEYMDLKRKTKHVKCKNRRIFSFAIYSEIKVYVMGTAYCMHGTE
jgi:hypothetical protein